MTVLFNLIFFLKKLELGKDLEKAQIERSQKHSEIEIQNFESKI